MEEERERWEGGRGTRDRGVFAPGAMYVFKYAYAHEITSRCVVFVTGSLLCEIYVRLRRNIGPGSSIRYLFDKKICQFTRIKSFRINLYFLSISVRRKQHFFISDKYARTRFESNHVPRITTAYPKMNWLRQK